MEQRTLTLMSRDLIIRLKCEKEFRNKNKRIVIRWTGRREGIKIQIKLEIDET